MARGGVPTGNSYARRLHRWVVFWDKKLKKWNNEKKKGGRGGHGGNGGQGGGTPPPPPNWPP